MTQTVSDRARTPLLTLITQESLDRDYQVAASRRGPDEHEGPASRTAVVLVLAAFAMLVTVAAVQTSRNADVNDASRASLIQRIESRRTVVGELQEQVAELRAANTAAEEDLRQLGDRLSSLRTRRAELGALTGFARVTGDGLRISLDNAPYADINAQLRDSDLTLLVDGLWAAGAEAIAINGQRLTAMSAIRNSGPAIEVNSVGIAPPYTVTAIGDRRSLSADFITSRSGQAFVTLAQQYGFRYELDNVESVELPAAPLTQRRLRSAERRKQPKVQGGSAP
jgi:uncharacterized protein YlxW (UPF0749 family)